MTLAPGGRIRPYEVISMLGAGVCDVLGSRAMPLQVLQRPDWHGTPHELGDLFVLHKNRREAHAVIVTHQLDWRTTRSGSNAGLSDAGGRALNRAKAEGGDAGEGLAIARSIQGRSRRPLYEPIEG
jgi:hypothetical protein